MHELGIALAQWAADAGMETDAAGVTLERWAGVALPPRRARASDPAAADGTPAGTSARRPGPAAAGDGPTREPAHPLPTALLAAMLGVAGLVLGGWATRARTDAEAMSPVREDRSTIAAAVAAAAAKLPPPPGEPPGVVVAPSTPVETQPVSPASSEGPMPASAIARSQATPASPAVATSPPSAPAGSPPPSAAPSAPPAMAPAQPPPRAPLPASRVPATPNF